MQTKPVLLAAALSLTLFGTRADAAVILNQIQTFDDPHSWVTGVGPVIGTPVPVPVLLGGPGGATDPFLSMVATGGSGPGSRLAAQNFGEWSGDYLAAGIDRIEMDVRNFGNTDLFIRLLFVEFGAMGPVNAAFTDARFVAGSSGWGTIAFNIDPGNLTALIGTAAGALSNAQELRIYHNPDPGFIPGQIPPVVGNLSVDNITATAVPEPATLLLVAAGLVCGVRRRSR